LHKLSGCARVPARDGEATSPHRCALPRCCARTSSPLLRLGPSVSSAAPQRLGGSATQDGTRHTPAPEGLDVRDTDGRGRSRTCHRDTGAVSRGLAAGLPGVAWRRPAARRSGAPRGSRVRTPCAAPGGRCGPRTRPSLPPAVHPPGTPSGCLRRRRPAERAAPWGGIVREVSSTRAASCVAGPWRRPPQDEGSGTGTPRCRSSVAP
jgi:hypothetical protein